MKLTFYGATKQVTGSMFLLEFDDEYRVLIDCGTNLSPKKSHFQQQNRSLFPFDASLINLVILTHAHIDHSGQIPNLYREGFEGQVVCTSPTMDLTEILLQDSAALNLRKLKQVEGKKKFSKKDKIEHTADLYLQKQVSEAIENFVPVAFEKRFKFKDNAFLTFYPAGHLLGAAHVFIEYYENNEKKTIAFSGDIGRKNYPLLVDPTPLPPADVMVMETTYGDRFHKNQEPANDLIQRTIHEACVAIPGRLIIPAFSIGRTQALLFTLYQLYLQKKLPQIKIFTDSPLARKSSRIYDKYAGFLNDEAIGFREEEGSLFDFENLTYVASDKESREISNHTEPCIIISSSGMVKGGRVEYHVANNIANPYATILMIGYATEGTLGHDLLNGITENIKIKGKNEAVRATIKTIDSFSGHGDFKDLLNFVKNQPSQSLKKLFLVHGEYSSMQHFKSEVEALGYTNVIIPDFNDSHEL